MERLCCFESSTRKKAPLNEHKLDATILYGAMIFLAARASPDTA